MNNIKLTKKAQELLLQSDEERIKYILEDRWINYPIAQNILDKLEDIFKYQKNKTRVTSMLVVGSSNNGKTSLLEEFKRRHLNYEIFNEKNEDETTNDFTELYDATGIPVLYLQAPTEPSESRLYDNIFSSIDTTVKKSENISRKQYLVEYYMKLLNVEMIIIDEIHNILSGSIAKQKQTMNAIKNLSNQLKIPIVLAGIKDSLRAISTDTQISSRFRPVYLTKWRLDKEYISLLATFLSTLPLKKESNILNPDVALKILDISEGYIGDIIGILKQSAVYAINTQSERITINEIRECGYISMSQVHKESILKDV
ncbi:MAG: TniB family NTP-binding protein [Candidatus Marinarcus sp.]|uniref:TniB family NTP-binding protein n=1 Tax=Candidatus Marinarcus sp. TaxID=3100987 RepID=UPI003B00CFC1